MNSLLKLCAAAALLLAAATSSASFHYFQIEQLYSNVDGTLQFIVLRESVGANGENLWAGHELTSAHGAVTKTYTFPNNLPGGEGEYCMGYYCYPNVSPTAHKRVLVATEGFAALGIVMPDYVIPNGFLPTDGGTVNYAGVDQVTFSALPTDGVNSINRSGANMPNVATNFAGQSASVHPGGSAPAPGLNFQGMWYAAPAESEAGWGVNLVHEGDVIFATWFTHDANGNAWNLSMTALQTGPNAFSGQLVVVTGPPFGAVPFNLLQVHASQVGSATLTFTDSTHGTFTYTVNGIMQTKSITRQVFAVLPTCAWGTLANLSLATNYTAMWWVVAGVESGWGINFDHQSNAIFATWFTFDFNGNPLPMSATLFRVGTSNVYTGTLIRTSGPPFSANPWNPGAVNRAEMGTATVTFLDGNRATFTFVGNASLNGVSQTKQLERQTLRVPGTACQ
jgi:hypothetical protein